MIKKLFISQPMRGLTLEEILKAREEIKNRAEKTIGEPLELINLYNTFNFITKSNKYDNSVEEYQNRITELCKRLQDLEEVK